MDKTQLISTLKENDSILPKDIINGSDLDTLARTMLSIFADEKEALRTNKRFQQNYIELVNYLLVTDLTKPRTSRRKFFDITFLNDLLALPMHT